MPHSASSGIDFYVYFLIARTSYFLTGYNIHAAYYYNDRIRRGDSKDAVSQTNTGPVCRLKSGTGVSQKIQVLLNNCGPVTEAGPIPYAHTIFLP